MMLDRLRTLFGSSHPHIDAVTDEAERIRKRANKAIDSWDTQETMLREERRQRDAPARAIREAQRRLGEYG